MLKLLRWMAGANYQPTFAYAPVSPFEPVGPLEPWPNQPLHPGPIIDEYNKRTGLSVIVDIMDKMDDCEREATMLYLNNKYGQDAH